MLAIVKSVLLRLTCLHYLNSSSKWEHAMVFSGLCKDFHIIKMARFAYLSLLVYYWLIDRGGILWMKLLVSL